MRAVPSTDDKTTATRQPFAYAAIRVVPRVEREEFVNVGVVLYARPLKYLGVRTGLNRDRLLALWPDIELDPIERQLQVIRHVAAGDPTGGAIADLPESERFGWISAPSSTVVQPGPIHTGLTHDPAITLDTLFSELVG